MGNRPSAPPPPPPRTSYVDQQIRQIGRTAGSDADFPYYSQAYGQSCPCHQLAPTREEAEYYRMYHEVKQGSVPGLLQVRVDTPGQPLPIDEAIEVSGLDGCYSFTADGQIRRIECPCHHCEKDGMINGVCRQLAHPAKSSAVDYLDDVQDQYPAHRVTPRRTQEYPVYGGAASRLSPVTMHNVVLPPYRGQESDRDETTDGLYDRAVARQELDSRGGYSEDEDEDEYGDEELDSIDRYRTPRGNKRFL